jgi:hypothetical protein
MPVVYPSKMFFMKGIQSANQISYSSMLQLAFLQPLNVSLAFVDIGNTRCNPPFRFLVFTFPVRKEF